MQAHVGLLVFFFGGTLIYPWVERQKRTNRGRGSGEIMSVSKGRNDNYKGDLVLWSFTIIQVTHNES